MLECERMKRKVLLELCMRGVYEGERILELGNQALWLCNLTKKEFQTEL